jgi:predicted Ser/Thr protein kinase
MNNPRRCPQCGTELTAGSPEKLCPRCLLRAGLESQGVPLSPLTAAYSPTFQAPTPAELSGYFPHLEILELLGAGGMGAVYKARQPELDRLVAVKILPQDVGRDPAFFQRFEREAKLLGKLNHPNIVILFEFGHAFPTDANGTVNDQTGLYFFVMEYVDGVNLRQALRTGKLTPPEALKIVPQICDALQFAHEEGVVHRDIKPENILLDKRGRVKIADFGLAKLFDDKPNANLTGTRQVMGTPHYMAPEQIQGTRDVDHRADIYSLGVTFYEMLTGELPLGRFAPPSKKVRIDVRLDEVVLRTLETEPEKRYQHAGDVKTEVEMIGGARQSGPLRAGRACPTDSWEFRSKAAIFGIPLVHVAFGPDPKTGRPRFAKGIVAVGSMAVGVVAFGGVAMGGLTLGGLSLGVFATGGVALGLLAASGGVAVGTVAAGGVSVGALAAGGLPISMKFWWLIIGLWSLIGLMYSIVRKFEPVIVAQPATHPDTSKNVRPFVPAPPSAEQVTHIPQPRAPDARPDNAHLERVIADLLPDDKVGAVRTYREATGASLPEAVAALKAIAAKHGLNRRWPVLTPELVLRCLIGALGFILGGIWLAQTQPVEVQGNRFMFRAGGVLLALFWVSRTLFPKQRWRLEDFKDTEPKNAPLPVTKEPPPARGPIRWLLSRPAAFGQWAQRLVGRLVQPLFANFWVWTGLCILLFIWLWLPYAPPTSGPVASPLYGILDQHIWPYEGRSEHTVSLHPAARNFQSVVIKESREISGRGLLSVLGWPGDGRASFLARDDFDIALTNSSGRTCHLTVDGRNHLRWSYKDKKGKRHTNAAPLNKETVAQFIEGCTGDSKEVVLDQAKLVFEVVTRSSSEDTIRGTTLAGERPPVGRLESIVSNQRLLGDVTFSEHVGTTLLERRRSMPLEIGVPIMFGVWLVGLIAMRRRRRSRATA